MKLYNVTYTVVNPRTGQSLYATSEFCAAPNKEDAIAKFTKAEHFRVSAKEIDVVNGYRVSLTR